MSAILPGEVVLEGATRSFSLLHERSRTLKELFLTDRGEAYVDLSAELSKNHLGGSLDEILTVYTLVSALTENLPSITRVQILIDGREVDTLAGHVDLRRPLARASEWIEQPTPAKPAGN